MHNSIIILWNFFFFQPFSFPLLFIRLAPPPAACLWASLVMNQTHQTESFLPEVSTSGGVARNGRSQNPFPSSGFYHWCCLIGPLTISLLLLFQSTCQAQSGDEGLMTMLMSVITHLQTVVRWKLHGPWERATFMLTKYRAAMSLITICRNLWRKAAEERNN